MSTPEQEILEKRKKRTIFLMAGGAASLILPLLGVVYLQMNEAKTARPPDSSVTFERREDGDSKIRVSQTVTIVNPPALAGSGVSSLPVAGGLTESPAPGGSSLDFVKGGENNTYYQDKPSVAAAAASTPTVTASEPLPETKASVKAIAQKSGKKSFNMPRLQGVKGFNSFKGASPKPTGGAGLTGVADPQAGKGDDDMSEMLKGIPGGANNPEVQKYLKSQGK